MSSHTLSTIMIIIIMLLLLMLLHYTHSLLFRTAAAKERLESKIEDGWRANF